MSTDSTLKALRAAGHLELAAQYESAVARLDPLTAALPGAIDWRIRARQDLDLAIAAIRLQDGFESFAMRLSDEQVFELVAANARRCPVVYLVADSVGGMGLILRGDAEVESLELPDLALSDLAPRVVSYLTTYSERRWGVALTGDAWRAAIEELTGYLGTALGRPLASLLAAAAVPDIVVIPTGMLSLVPVHAPWTYDPVDLGRRNYIADTVCISYAPNGQSTQSRGGPSADDHDRLFAVADPSADSPLPGSEAEIAAAAAWFPGRTQTLVGQNATKARVLSALAGHEVVHLSCHGIADPITPLKGSLSWPMNP